MARKKFAHLKKAARKRPVRIIIEEETAFSFEDGVDPFDVIGSVPKDKTYQWVAVSVAGNEHAAARTLAQMKAGGWRPVPARRHPAMPRNKKRIEYGGQVLMERSAKATHQAKDKEYQRALSLIKEQNEAVRGGTSTPSYVRDVQSDLGEKPFVPNPDAITKAKESLQFVNGVYYVEIPIRVAITDNEIETAILMLRLDPSEYVRRRIVMNTTALVADDTMTFPYHDSGMRRDTPIFRRAEIKVHRLEA